MKRNKYWPAVLFISLLLLNSCRDKNEEFTICGTSCSSSKPWAVESLDQGLPCFATQNECAQWAASHGYGGKPCVNCAR